MLKALKKLNNRGLTLIELMTAIAVVAIISGPLLQLFVTSTKVGRNSYDTDKANAAAVDIVEQIKRDLGENELVKTVMRDEISAAETHYYDIDWNETAVVAEGGEAPMSYAFSATVAVAALPGSPESVGQSYIKKLVHKTGADIGKEYTVEIPPVMAGPIAITVAEWADGTGYSVSYTGGSGEMSIPNEDFEDGSKVIPVVMDLRGMQVGDITVNVSNASDKDLQIYVYDYNKSLSITGQALEDSISGFTINFMQFQNSEIKFDELDVGVLVEKKGGSVLADYKTLVYLSGVSTDGK